MFFFSVVCFGCLVVLIDCFFLHPSSVVSCVGWCFIWLVLSLIYVGSLIRVLSSVFCFVIRGSFFHPPVALSSIASFCVFVASRCVLAILFVLAIFCVLAILCVLAIHLYDATFFVLPSVVCVVMLCVMACCVLPCFCVLPVSVC